MVFATTVHRSPPVVLALALPAFTPPSSAISRDETFSNELLGRALKVGLDERAKEVRELAALSYAEAELADDARQQCLRDG